MVKGRLLGDQDKTVQEKRQRKGNRNGKRKERETAKERKEKRPRKGKRNNSQGQDKVTAIGCGDI